MKAFLVLEDGTVFEGLSAGALGSVSGELIFNTSMTGYQEIITDPANLQKILLMPCPLTGNCGLNDEDNESEKVQINGLIVRELCKNPSNWRMNQTLGDFLKNNNTVAIEGIDTRNLTEVLRQKGTIRCALTTEVKHDYCGLANMAKKAVAKNPLAGVSCKQAYSINARDEEFKVALIDLGTKKSIIKTLNNFGCSVTVFPAYTKPGNISKGGFDGIVLSGGPGNPKEYVEIIENIKQLQSFSIPMFGISLGHLLIALANGSDTEKMLNPHRGSNYPTVFKSKSTTQITTQNHGFVVKSNSICKEKAYVTHYNLNDNTTEGIMYKNLPVFSVQFYPGETLSPFDTGYCYSMFTQMMREGKHAKKQ